MPAKGWPNKPKPVCPECGGEGDAHKLTCPVLLSPDARAELRRRRIWRRRVFRWKRS